MIMARAKKMVGLDLGSDEIKAIEIQSSGSSLTITNYAQAQVPVGAVEIDEQSREPKHTDAYIDFVRDTIKSHGFKNRRCVTAVSGRSVIVRYVSMAQQPDDVLKKNVFQEADKYIPFENTSEVIMDCQKIEEQESSGSEVKVLLVAVKRDVIDKHVQMLKRMGFTSHIIDVDAFALGNSFESVNMLAGTPPADKVVALLDISATKSNVNIVSGKASFFTREVYLGGAGFDRRHRQTVVNRFW
ncbi:type IV pilus biogenesis protein PilM [Planctomycetota bacterium]